jgi:hypothetical protein
VLPVPVAVVVEIPPTQAEAQVRVVVVAEALAVRGLLLQLAERLTPVRVVAVLGSMVEPTELMGRVVRV